MRVSISYPVVPVGDGDGLPISRVHKIFGFFENDLPVVDNEVKRILWLQYMPYFGDQDSPQLEGVELRCRLLGYDTQETPKPGDVALNVDQRYWKEGKEFLARELDGLRGGKSKGSCKLLIDVYSIDIFQRLLVDIRGLFQDELHPEPQLLRFELAERALDSGYAVPTTSHYTNNSLVEKFRAARENRKGGFSEGEESFVHPLRCRRARYRKELEKTHRRRSRYVE